MPLILAGLFFGGVGATGLLLHDVKDLMKNPVVLGAAAVAALVVLRQNKLI